LKSTELTKGEELRIPSKERCCLGVVADQFQTVDLQAEEADVGAMLDEVWIPETPDTC
jgi:hypothetical protein